MKFTVLTIFPELMQAFWENGIMRRSVAEGIIDPAAIDIRQFAEGRHKVTDDRPYGGGGNNGERGPGRFTPGSFYGTFGWLL